MADVDTLKGSQILIQIGDGGAPTEVFAHPCLINAERGIEFSSSTTSQVIPDCDNPDDPAWEQIEKDGLAATINGSGMLHLGSVEEFDAWYNSNDAKNVKVKLNKAGGSTWTGPFKLTGWQIGDNRNDKATASITLRGTGKVTRADNT